MIDALTSTPSPARVDRPASDVAAPPPSPKKKRKSEPAPGDGFERAPAPAKKAKSSDAAALDSFKLIQELGTEARNLKAELAASKGVHESIDDQATSESMTGAQFRLASRSARFSSKVLNKAVGFALKNGTGGASDPRLSADDRAQLGALQGALQGALMRSKDSALTMGERHQASVDVADTLIALQEFANKKAVDTVVDEGKKAWSSAGDWLARKLGGEK